MKEILYLSYDGMTDPLGQSQVIPYLQGLAKSGYRFTIVSFEKKERFNKNGPFIKSLLDASGIKWKPRIFSSKPPVLSKLYDKWQMKRVAVKAHRKEIFSFIHCRSYVSADIGQYMLRKYGIPFLFDMRGFWVDERVDSGQWNMHKPLYRFLYNFYKKKEKSFLKKSFHIISLTWTAKEELINAFGIASDKITVIPCCVDLALFDYKLIDKETVLNKKKELNITRHDKVITYLGTLGGGYVFNEMLEFFKELKRKKGSIKFLFITQGSREAIITAATSLNIATNDIIVQSASRNEVPVYLALSDWSIFFSKNVYSKKASSPTKQGEIMAMGIPIICNDVGDTARVLIESGAGLVANSFLPVEYNRIIDSLNSLELIGKDKIRDSAFKYYDLEKGIIEYLKVYKKMTGIE